jgi:hypothetical protein
MTAVVSLSLLRYPTGLKTPNEVRSSPPVRQPLGPEKALLVMTLHCAVAPTDLPPPRFRSAHVENDVATGVRSQRYAWLMRPVLQPAAGSANLCCTLQELHASHSERICVPAVADIANEAVFRHARAVSHID